MSDFEKALQELKNEINSLPELKEYFSLKKQVEENKEIQELDKEVRKHQKAMCKNKDNDEVYLKEKELYETLLAKLESHPLYQNYIIAKQDAEDVLLEIKENLE